MRAPRVLAGVAAAGILAGVVAVGVSAPAAAASGEAVIQVGPPADNSWYVDGIYVGQSFKAVVTGFITEIGLYPLTFDNPEFTTGPIEFFEGQGFSGIKIGETEAVTWTAPVSAAAPFPATLQTVPLNTPIPVTAGSTYSFAIPMAGGEGQTPRFQPSVGDIYADGIILLLNPPFFEVPSLDMAFTLRFTVLPSGASEAPIPSWVQAYGRASKDATCEDGWSPSWQSWAEPVTGGWVCTRSIPSLG